MCLSCLGGLIDPRGSGFDSLLAICFQDNLPLKFVRRTKKIGTEKNDQAPLDGDIQRALDEMKAQLDKKKPKRLLRVTVVTVTTQHQICKRVLITDISLALKSKLLTPLVKWKSLGGVVSTVP